MTTQDVKTQTQEKFSQENEEEKKPKKRPFFLFQDFGLLVAFWNIISVEKEQEYFKGQGWLYGIVLNKGIESSPNQPFGERKIWYPSYAVREAKFEEIIKAMTEHNYEFTKI